MRINSWCDSRTMRVVTGKFSAITIPLTIRRGNWFGTTEKSTDVWWITRYVKLVHSTKAALFKRKKWFGAELTHKWSLSLIWCCIYGGHDAVVQNGWKLRFSPQSDYDHWRNNADFQKNLKNTHFRGGQPSSMVIQPASVGDVKSALTGLNAVFLLIGRCL